MDDGCWRGDIGFVVHSTRLETPSRISMPCGGRGLHLRGVHANGPRPQRKVFAVEEGGGVIQPVWVWR